MVPAKAQSCRQCEPADEANQIRGYVVEVI